MFFNGKDWVEDTDDYGFIPRAKEIAAAGKAPECKKSGINRWFMYLDPIAKIEINCSLDGVFSVSLMFQEGNILLSAPFYTLQAAKVAGMNKIESVMYDTHRGLEAAYETFTDEEQEQSGFRGEVRDWVKIAGIDSNTLFTNGGRIVERQPFDRSEADLSPDIDNPTPETGQGPKTGP